MILIRLRRYAIGPGPLLFAYVIETVFLICAFSVFGIISAMTRQFEEWKIQTGWK